MKASVWASPFGLLGTIQIFKNPLYHFGCSLGCLKTAGKDYLFRRKYSPRSIKSGMTQHQTHGHFSLTLSSPQPLPRLYKSAPFPAPQPWVNVCIRKILWTFQQRKAKATKRGKSCATVSPSATSMVQLRHLSRLPPLGSVSHECGPRSRIAYHQQSCGPLSTVRGYACPKKDGLGAMRFPSDLLDSEVLQFSPDPWFCHSPSVLCPSPCLLLFPDMCYTFLFIYTSQVFVGNCTF